MGSDLSQGSYASLSKAQKGSESPRTPDEHFGANLLLFEGLPDLGLSLGFERSF